MKENQNPTSEIYPQYDKWLQSLHADNAKRVIKSAKSGHIDLILFCLSGNLAALRLVKNRYGYSNHFLTAVPRNTQTLTELPLVDDPWEMLIPQEEVTLENLAKELPSFLEDYYPEADSVPINIFYSKKKFRMGDPLLTIRIINNLVTIDKSS